MTHREFGVLLILFGVLAVGGTIGDAIRKAGTQPDWVALNARSWLRGVLVWLVIGVAA